MVQRRVSLIGFRGVEEFITQPSSLAFLRKIALNIVGRDKTTKASVRAQRKKAAWNDAYMLKLLAG